MSNQDELIQPNQLARARFNFTQDEMKVLVFIIRSFQDELRDQILTKRIHQTDLFGNYKFNQVKISEIDPENNYSRMRKAIGSLNSKKITVPTPEYEADCHLIEMPKYYAGRGVVDFTLNADLIPSFQSLALGWFRFDVTTLFQLNSAAQRFYMLMCQHEDTGIVRINAKELKEVLGLEDKYPQFRVFKKWIIEKSQNEINDLFLQKKCKLKFIYDDKGSKPKTKGDEWDRTLTFKVVSYNNKHRGNGQNAHNYYYEQYEACLNILQRIYANNEPLLKQYINYVTPFPLEKMELLAHRLQRLQKEAALAKTTLYNNPKYQKLVSKILQEDFGYIKVHNREGFDPSKYLNRSNAVTR